ncbi:hypothetical protein GMORB2_5690 [Geosmithia morbida]|uniref:Secreted protein n=1 Tax=Geosmithia morbida TaxID=1094350 RepID=A0A9P4YZP1_9HYPO|nr:uncharacterized protein GMORB2_5690 [Geosmithia morbida]KAF4123974.1 hypothetical protein GMORB2_5690 [Geosmithia morbida]
MSGTAGFGVWVAWALLSPLLEMASRPRTDEKPCFGLFPENTDGCGTVDVGHLDGDGRAHSLGHQQGVVGRNRNDRSRVPMASVEKTGVRLHADADDGADDQRRLDIACVRHGICFT